MNSAMMKESEAKGVKGCLLFSPFDLPGAEKAPEDAHRHRVVFVDEKAVKNVVGHFFFRVSTGKGPTYKYRDYQICVETLKIKIMSHSASLYTGVASRHTVDVEDGGFLLDWSSEVLHRSPKCTKEVSAENVEGFLINHQDGRTVFRVYEDKKYTDYRIGIEDMDIEILSGNVSLFEEEGRKGGKIGWKKYKHSEQP